MIIKNIAQMMPLAITTKETPRGWLKTPAIKLPKGMNPAKVSIKTLITLPRNSSGTIACNIVLIKATAVTLEAPTNIKVKSEKNKSLDKENKIKDTENISVE